MNFLPHQSTSKKFNKDGIDEYVRLRTKEKKDNNQATTN